MPSPPELGVDGADITEHVRSGFLHSKGRSVAYRERLLVRLCGWAPRPRPRSFLRETPSRRAWSSPPCGSLALGRLRWHSHQLVIPPAALVNHSALSVRRVNSDAGRLYSTPTHRSEPLLTGIYKRLTACEVQRAALLHHCCITSRCRRTAARAPRNARRRLLMRTSRPTSTPAGPTT